MFVLVATPAPPFVDSLDGHDPIDGEIVVGPFGACRCGIVCSCERSWVGIASDGTTPTAMVARRPGIHPEQLRAAMASMLDRAEARHFGTSQHHSADDLVDAYLLTMSRILIEFPVGAVLARHGDRLMALDITDAA